MICVHQQDAAYALTLTLGRVEHGLAGLQRTGVYTEEAQSADIRVGHDLERKRRERCAVGGLTGLLLVGIGVHAAYCGDIQGRGHIIDDGVKQLLHAFVFVGSSADDGHHLDSAGGLSDGGTDHILRDLLALEIKHHYLIIEVGNGFEHLGSVLLGEITHILRDGLITHIVAEIVIVDTGVHFDQVNYAPEISFSTDGELNGDRITFKSVMYHLEDMIEVGAHDIHFINVYHSGNVVMVGLSPYCLGLRLNAALCTEDRHTAVEYSQRTLDFNGEVNMTRGIDDIDAGIAPVAGGCGGGDGDATLLLLLHPVHGRSTLMGLTYLVVDAGIVKNTLSGRSLTGIDVSHDSDISGFFK